MPGPITRDEFDAFYDGLIEGIEGEVRLDAMDRALYSTDASLYRVEPFGVVIPASEEDVRTTVQLAARYGIPVLPRGGGSSLAGQAVGAAIVIDFSKYLDEILEINPLAGWVRVQPGIVLDRLNEAVLPHGLMAGPDPASSNRATIGGMMANNATGTRSILYGSFADHIIGAKVLLADGSEAVFEAVDRGEWGARGGRPGLEGAICRQIGDLIDEQADVIRRKTPSHWRRSGGYRAERLIDTDAPNLAHLLCGSEGTLAVATEIKLKLVPRPALTALGIIHFSSRRLALEAVQHVLSTGPSAVELFDHVGIERCRKVSEYARRLTFIEGDPRALLITEYYGASDAELAGKLAGLREVLAARDLGYAVVEARDPAQIRNVWAVRNAGLGLVMGVKGDHKPVAFIEDAAVPVEHLPEYIDRLERLMAEENTPSVMYAHASAGCLHVRPFINMKDAGDLEKMRRLARGSMELVKRFGGTLSSEHGDGYVRSWLNEEFFGPELFGVYRRIKEIFDPQGILNPGKVIDAPGMTDHLRISPDYETVEFEEDLDFSEDGGFARSVELCNGSGVCRKLDSGTMCPSFMVTRDEEDSTRARANALREALSGRLPAEELYSDRMYRVMELCIQCKGCKAECPSVVDMAKLKVEWLSHFWRENKPAVRDRLFARIPDVMARGRGGLRSFAERLGRTGPGRRMIERHLGISARREMPALADESFIAWFSKGRRPSAGKRVVLYADTFNNFSHPEVSRAAFELLTGIGFSVIVPEYTCCGRTWIARGFLDDARRKAEATIEVLAPYAQEGLSIVGLEPSCILTLRDEYCSMFPGDARAEAVASAALTIDEFVARLGREGALGGIRWKKPARDLLLHVHCHQKALSGEAPAVAALKTAGYNVTVVDSGCCGMAGSFGYEAEHYDISIAMAERRLAPAVREAAPGTLIVASGVSCQAQIEHCTGRKAVHSAEALRAVLAGG